MKLYSIEEIAKEYEITPRKARDWIRRGSIPYKKLPKTRKYTKTINVSDIIYYSEPIVGNIQKFYEEGDTNDI